MFFRGIPNEGVIRCFVKQRKELVEKKLEPGKKRDGRFRVCHALLYRLGIEQRQFEVVISLENSQKRTTPYFPTRLGERLRCTVTRLPSNFEVCTADSWGVRGVRVDFLPPFTSPSWDGGSVCGETPPTTHPNFISLA